MSVSFERVNVSKLFRALHSFAYFFSNFCWYAGIVADSNAYDQSKRLRTGGDYTHTAYTTSPYHPPPPAVWGPHGYV